MVRRRLALTATAGVVALAATPAAFGQGVIPSVRLQTAIGTGPYLFGDQMQARLDVFVNRSRTDVESVRVDTNFFPYKRLGAPRRTSVRDGNTQRISYSYRLECVTIHCFPGLTKQQFKVLFPYAVVRYREQNGARRGLAVKWPTFRLLSRLPPLTAAQLRLQAPITTGLSPAAAMFAPVAVPAATYRMSPALLAVLLVAGALLATAAGAVVGRPVLAHIRSTRQAPEGPTLTSLERALERVEQSADATGRGDREALALLARELARAGRPDDARLARRLAWSEHEPMADDSIALVRPRADGAIPLADAAALSPTARRTRFMRIGVCVALVLLLAACLVAAFRLRTRPTSYFAHGGGFVVADFSKSIDPRAYQRMGQLLRTLADSDQRLGLIVFAEDAYEMLPAGTRGDALRPMLRYYDVGTGADAVLTLGAQETPWTKAFLGGTSIGRALRLARDLLQQEPNSRRSVLLVSDLDDATSDVPLMTQEIGHFRDSGIALRVVPLFPSAEDLAFFSGLAGPNAILSGNQLTENAKVAERQSVVGSFPVWLVLPALALLLGLAAAELLIRRLEWSTA